MYLADGLYATITVGAGENARQIMTTLDYEHAPLATANFIRIVEGNAEQAGGRGGRPPSGRGFGGRGGPEPPPIGTIVTVKGGLASAIVESETLKSVAIPRRPKTKNTAIVHDAAGILGASGPNTFYLTLQANKGLDGKYAAIGKVIGGLSQVPTLEPGEPIRSIRITRVGQAARDFKTDDEAFKALMGGKK